MNDGIADLSRIPQDALVFAGEEESPPIISNDIQQELHFHYMERFFRPWHLQEASLPADEAFWGVRVYGSKTGYAENLLPWSVARWDKLVASQVMNAYPSMARKAIVVRNESLRVLPSRSPFFLDPTKAGEGYPFDYFQNSAIWHGTPVLVTHTTADGGWFFVESGYAYGWLPADAVAWAPGAFRALYEGGPYAASTQDNAVFKDEDGDYLARAHVGALFPIMGVYRSGSSMIGKNDVVSQVLLVPVRDAMGFAVPRFANVSISQAAPLPLPLSTHMVATVANRIMGQPYGWGGYLENRDCSATMRDIFTMFGVWLPRNSSQQAQRGGKLISAEGMTAREKETLLLEQGIPFYTLIWFKGHIGLYLGADDATGEPIMLHDVWGVRTKKRGKEGRAIIGKLAITTLHPGEERSDVPKNSLYDRMLGITMLPSSVLPE